MWVYLCAPAVLVNANAKGLGSISNTNGTCCVLKTPLQPVDQTAEIMFLFFLCSIFVEKLVCKLENLLLLF